MKTFILLVILYTVHAHHRHGHLGDSEEHKDEILKNNPLLKETNVVTEFLKPTVKVQHIGFDSSSDNSKVTIQIPANVQQVVTQVSQHVPVVIHHHLEQMRMPNAPSMRSVQSYATQAQYHIGNNHVATEQDKKCAFQCTRYDMPVCGHNGRCYREFESQCSLSKYNCLHTQNTFRTVDEALCMDTTTTKCYQGDM